MWEMRLAWFHTCYVLISLCLSSGCSMASRTWYVLICLSSGCSMASSTLGQTVELLLAGELQLCFSSGIHAAQSSHTTSRWWHHTELPVKPTTSSLGLFRAGPSSSPLSALPLPCAFGGARPGSSCACGGLAPPSLLQLSLELCNLWLCIFWQVSCLHVAIKRKLQTLVSLEF